MEKQLHSNENGEGLSLSGVVIVASLLPETTIKYECLGPPSASSKLENCCSSRHPSSPFLSLPSPRLFKCIAFQPLLLTVLSASTLAPFSICLPHNSLNIFRTDLIASVSNLQFFTDFGPSPPFPSSIWCLPAHHPVAPITLPFVGCLEGISVPIIAGLWLLHLLECSSSNLQPVTSYPLTFEFNQSSLLREDFFDPFRDCQASDPLPTSCLLIAWNISLSGPFPCL